MSETSHGHRLGPHVVGRRVVVRRLLPDGRATDLLGTCTAWDAEAMTLRPDGAPESPAIVVPLREVVTGKPVPPRASVRARVSPREVELHSFAGHPEVRREPIGGWLVRSAPPMGGRLLKRANSALAMADPGLPVAEASARVVAAYEALGRRPLAQVERAGDLEGALVALGWAPLGIGDSETMLAGVAQAVRALPAAPDPAQVRLEVGAGPEGADGLVVTLPDAGARGQAALDGDWLCLHSLVVDPDHRRRGWARLVLAELLDWGASRGARTVWLHVESDNAPALALYERLGFRSHHANRYLGFGPAPAPAPEPAPGTGADG